MHLAKAEPPQAARIVSGVRSALGERGYELETAAGATAPWEEAVALAREVV